jgi:hypothetical protein
MDEVEEGGGGAPWVDARSDEERAGVKRERTLLSAAWVYIRKKKKKKRPTN